MGQFIKNVELHISTGSLMATCTNLVASFITPGAHTHAHTHTSALFSQINRRGISPRLQPHDAFSGLAGLRVRLEETANMCLSSCYYSVFYVLTTFKKGTHLQIA